MAMLRISRFASAAAVAIGCLACGAASAHGHWHGGPRFGFDFVIGPGPWWWWDSPLYYPPAVVAAPAPMYVQPSTAQMPAPINYWYFCPQSNTYYPYVTDCPGGWQQIAPQPPAPATRPR
jgi:hypothetical protein